MTNTPDALRRLIDLPGVRDLEFRAVLKRDFAEPEARAEFPEINACALALFGLNKPDSGEILLGGKSVRVRSPRDAATAKALR